MLDARCSIHRIVAPRKKLTSEEELRRSGIFIARGVSPGNRAAKYEQAPEGGDRYLYETAAAHGTARVCRPSGALIFWGIPTPGLTPRAKHLSPLRGSRPQQATDKPPKGATDG